MSQSTFKENLIAGKVGESRIASWLRQRGQSVLPVYELIKNQGKGPVLLLPDRPLIAPDMFVFSRDAWWIEAKHKAAFTWHRLSGKWTTGIDLRHYRDYCEVDQLTPWQVWLLFLHEEGCAKDSPAGCPSGLFGNKLGYLKKHENHRSEKWGKSGMVYWAVDHLKKMASLAEIRE